MNETVTLTIRHRTVYRYTQPVRFSEHRVLFRPREAHDIDVLSADVRLNVAADVRWIHDVHSNSVAIVLPREDAAELEFDCSVRLRHRGVDNIALPLEPRALTMPVALDSEERQVLAPWISPVDDDPGATVANWAKGFAGTSPDTRSTLDAMLAAIRGFQYEPRDAEGTQTAPQTLAMRRGTCRDWAWLMIEALRSLGLACRFVSGYLYDPSRDPGPGSSGDARTGSGATHAWLHVYLPGAGWVPYDPTNLLTGGTDLIRVAYARRPQDALPLSGSWFGPTGASLGMTVEVDVRRT